MFDNDYDLSDNIISIGVFFIIYLAISIVLFFVFSPVLSYFFNGLSSAGEGLLAGYSDYISYLVFILNLFFALVIAYPIVWIIFKVFEREYDISFWR